MNEVSEHDIRARAHELWQQAGKPEGKHDEFWLQAEQELKAGKPDPKTLDKAEPRLE